MNRQTAINVLEKYTDRDVGIGKIVIEAHELAIDALQKQIPQKPNIEGDGYDDKGNLIYDTWICPNCEKRYETEYDDYKFCPECGQKIDWNSED